MDGPITIYNKARFKYLPKVLKRTLSQSPRDDMRFIGTGYGGWCVPERLVGPDSIVYCVGCGEDVTFDLGMIERFGCHVWAFDPTPRAIAHVDRERAAATPPVREKYHFRPVGLWSEDKRTTFFLNDNPAFDSGSLVGLNGVGQSIEVDVRRLSTVMADNGHDRVDLLKLDIEGAEYEVLDDLLKSSIRPAWVGVEFDQPVPFRKTHAMIRRMREAGYEVADIRVWDYAFVHRDAKR